MIDETMLDRVCEGVRFLPDRVSGTDTAAGRMALERDGAVILTGWPLEADSLVNAAAAVLGTKLRQLERIQKRATRDMPCEQGPSPDVLHTDGSSLRVDIAHRIVHLRIPDPDFVAILCTQPAPTGGESAVADGRKLVEQIRTEAPDLYEFLTTVDIDVTSRIPGVDPHRVPSLHRMVEWTRGGRMMVHVASCAQPGPRETDWDEHERLISCYNDVLGAVGDQRDTDTVLQAGEILLLDNYRCLHGVRGHTGTRTSYVLRCKTKDAN